jgi:hypothetical protein
MQLKKFLSSCNRRDRKNKKKLQELVNRQKSSQTDVPLIQSTQAQSITTITTSTMEKKSFLRTSDTFLIHQLMMMKRACQAMKKIYPSIRTTILMLIL